MAGHLASLAHSGAATLGLLASPSPPARAVTRSADLGECGGPSHDCQIARMGSAIIRSSSG